MSSGWNLPDGCAQADIDIAFGSATRCSRCRRIWYYDEDKPNAGCPKCARMEEEADYLRDREEDERAERYSDE